MPNTSLDDLSPNARDLAEQSLAWSELRWDPEAALLGAKRGTHGQHHRLGTRNSVWTAVGFLLRNQEGDTEKALRTLEALLKTQLDEPGMPYHGTFYRYIGEPHPPGMDAVMWQDYDPNWRQFIGLGFATILEEYGHRLTDDLIKRIEQSLELAVVGEHPDRCPPSYTNIALMKAAMNVWVGKRLGNADMVSYGEAFGKDVTDLFRQTDAYAEYNSPTYYGTNFYALGFWRRYLGDSTLHEMGAYMEAELWRDTARYYHADLKNLSGPYSRSYGMDMTRYTALVSLPFWMAFGKALTPFPVEDNQSGGRSGIDNEFAYGPCLAIYDSNAPADVLESISTFAGPRQIEKTITVEPKRVATAWLDTSYMLGAEHTGEYIARSYQHHAVTAHWRCPNGETGYLRLKHIGPTHARAEKGKVSLSAPVSPGVEARDGDSTVFIFEVFAPGLTTEALQPDTWSLAGMTVSVATNLPTPDITEAHNLFSITYNAPAGTASFDLGFLNTER